MQQSVPVAPVGEIADGCARVVSVLGRDVAVFRDGEAYFAIDDCCPHAGASLAGGSVQDGCVTCPWHAWRFRLSDGAWADSPRVKTRTYETAIIDGIVCVIPPAANGVT